jgi:hypothetical protein
MKRCAVAGYLFGVVVDGDPETFVGETPRLGLEDQIVADHAQRLQIGRTSGAILLLFKPTLFLGCIGAGGGSILGLGHATSKRIRYD